MANSTVGCKYYYLHTYCAEQKCIHTVAYGIVNIGEKLFSVHIELLNVALQVLQIMHFLFSMPVVY